MPSHKKKEEIQVASIAIILRDGEPLLRIKYDGINFREPCDVVYYILDQAKDSCFSKYIDTDKPKLKKL